jgi:hypothetical protein
MASPKPSPGSLATVTKEKRREIAESGDGSGFVDTTPPADALDAHDQYRAAKLAAQLASAESKPISECSL